jgi:hypothetical protein
MLAPLEAFFESIDNAILVVRGVCPAKPMDALGQLCFIQHNQFA